MVDMDRISVSLLLSTWKEFRKDALKKIVYTTTNNMGIINTLMLEAMPGETDAEKRYMAFAEQAGTENYPGVTTLLTGLSYAEVVHAVNHKRALEKNGYNVLCHLLSDRLSCPRGQSLIEDHIFYSFGSSSLLSCSSSPPSSPISES